MKKFNPADNGVHLPFDDVDFINAWQEWLAYRKERKLANYVPRGLKQTFTKLFTESAGNPQIAVAMINQAMACSWQGIYPLKTPFKNGQEQGNSNQATRQSVNDLYSQRFGNG